MAFADGTAPPPEWAAGPGPSGPDAGERSAAGLDELRAVLAEAESAPREPSRRTGRGRRAPAPPDPESDPRTRGAEPDPHDWARQIVLRQLTAAPRSRSQLARALRKKDCPDDVATAVLDRMEEVGLVDDEAYAGMLVRSQQAGRGLATRALRQELRRKGVDDDTAAAALAEVDPHAEEERARLLVAKKLRTMSGLEPVVQTRRLAGMLARKGYDAEVTMRVVREAVREAPEHQRD
jgi:regulatory protein